MKNGHTQIAADLNISYSAFKKRVKKYGEDAAVAQGEKKNNGGRPKERYFYNGENLSLWKVWLSLGRPCSYDYFSSKTKELGFDRAVSWSKTLPSKVTWKATILCAPADMKGHKNNYLNTPLLYEKKPEKILGISHLI